MQTGEGVCVCIATIKSSQRVGTKSVLSRIDIDFLMGLKSSTEFVHWENCSQISSRDGKVSRKCLTIFSARQNLMANDVHFRLPISMGRKFLGSGAVCFSL